MSGPADDMFDVEGSEGVEGLQVELIYSYYRSSDYEDRPAWVREIQENVNDFLDGKTVYSMDMDFAGEDKNRIYGKILYREE